MIICPSDTKMVGWEQYVEDVRKSLNAMPISIHFLKSGLKVTSTSEHEFNFEDGTTAMPQCNELRNFFNLQKANKKMCNVGDPAFESSATHFWYQLDLVQLAGLKVLEESCDVVMLSNNLAMALWHSGVRSQFPKCLLPLSTRATERVQNREQRIIQVRNWSW